MDNKDIYDKFNEIDFDISEFEEIPLDQVEKQRLKKSLKEKLANIDNYESNDSIDLTEVNKEKSEEEKIQFNKEKNGKMQRFMKKYKVAAVVAILAILIGMSPLGKEVIAQIAEKLIFTPSQGIIKQQVDKELYMLEEPVRINIDDSSALVKSITNDGENIYVEMWFNQDAEAEGIGYQREIINNLKLKTSDGNMYNVGLTSFASGGYAGFTFQQGEGLITDFKLHYKDKDIGEFNLKKVNFKNSYDEIGGNAMDKEVLLGATSYYEEGERYFKIWSNIDYKQREDYTISLDTIGKVEVRDEEGNLLSIENANDGTGRAFKILDPYKGKLDIKIKDIDINYVLKEGGKLAIKIPKKGKISEINEDLKLKGLQDSIKASSITNKGGEYTIHFDFSNNYDESRTIFMVRENFRTGGAMGDMENQQGEVYLDNEDLSITERFLRKIYIDINNVLVHQEGNWQFIVE
ncbi:hypothetical protein [Clostridium sp. UBA7503]|uniref:hypothetical protein n=1 Tax=Clostridium sp. UBA7503 TaxID=1946377 RepID=UPI0032163880